MRGDGVGQAGVIADLLPEGRIRRQIAGGRPDRFVQAAVVFDDIVGVIRVGGVVVRRLLDLVDLALDLREAPVDRAEG
jgi:hypothetical protein